jgi:LmbE family N-acetylglucosaminyl deacetylase
MRWIFLSPHFDDAAFSCGGIIWELSAAGQEVLIWTVCAGGIPPGDLSPFSVELHQKWQTGRQAVEQRRLEDLESCKRLGAISRQFGLPDCIYRRAGEDYWGPTPEEIIFSTSGTIHLYTSREAVFGPIHPAEAGLVDRLGQEISTVMPEQSELVCPLGIGGHVDHNLVRAAAERLDRPLWYYADFPYVLEGDDPGGELSQKGWQQRSFPITKAGLKAWYEGALAHASQISTFWEDPSAMHESLERLMELLGGAVLWQAKTLPSTGEL